MAQVGADGFVLFDALDKAHAPLEVTALPAVAVLGRVWARRFEREKDDGQDHGAPAGRVRLRPAQGRGPGDRIEPPYDIDARYRSKRGKS